MQGRVSRKLSLDRRAKTAQVHPTTTPGSPTPLHPFPWGLNQGQKGPQDVRESGPPPHPQVNPAIDDVMRTEAGIVTSQVGHGFVLLEL